MMVPKGRSGRESRLTKINYRSKQGAIVFERNYNLKKGEGDKKSYRNMELIGDGGQGTGTRREGKQNAVMGNIDQLAC